MIYVIANSPTYEISRLKEELIKNKLEFKIIGWQDITLPLKEVPDLCLIRGSVNIKTRFAFPYMECLIEEFERMGCLTIPPLKMITKCDKASTYLIWKKYLKNVIKMPESIITVNMDKAIQFIKKKKKVVFKPIIGGQGKGIKLLDENDVEKLESLLKYYGIIFLQEFIPNKNYDIRTIFIGEQFTTQFIRYNPNDFRNNLHCGGIGKTIEQAEELDPDIKKFCEKSEEFVYFLKSVLKFDMFGIDTIPSKDGELYFLEVNPFFGFHGADQTNNTNVAKEIIDNIIQKLNCSH